MTLPVRDGRRARVRGAVFPDAEPLVGTLLAFATYAVGFVARPVGGVIAGHFGDRAGRRNVLVVTLLVMGLATCAIGLLPTYETIGIAAPILLVTLRFIQGLGLGGEWGGAELMVSEHGDQKRRGLFASWPQVGVPAGNLLAAGVLALLASMLTDDAFMAWGWRVPFLLSAVLVFVGLFIRLRIEESPLFQRVEETATRARTPLVEVIREYPRQLAIAFSARIGTDVAFYVLSLFIITYATEEVGLSKSTPLNAVLIGSALQLFLIPAFGSLSDRLGRRPVYLAGVLGAAVWSFAFFPLLDTGAWWAIVAAAVGGLLFHALMYGGVHLRAVRDPGALQRRVDGLPARRHRRRRARPETAGRDLEERDVAGRRFVRETEREPASTDVAGTQ
jgi:MFS family permease